MNTDHPPVPRRRATDRERTATVDALGQAMSAAQISASEFEERSGKAWAAVFRDELPLLIADLTPDPEGIVGGDLSERRTGQGAHAQIRPSGEGSSLTVAIMGGSDMTGGWQCAPTHTSINIMGGSNFDFTHARLSAQRTILTTIDVMGGADIKVPEDFRVIMEGFALMGGSGIKDAPGVTLDMNDLPADAPTIVVRSYSLMGGSGIVRVPRNRAR